VDLLFPDGSTCDRVVYGAVQAEGPGWIGPAVPRPPAGTMLLRSGGDTDTASDWIASVPGREAFGPFDGRAFVEPFLCPDQMRDRLVREFRHAQFSVSIAIYEISDDAIGRELVEAEHRGVEVRLLVEGQPVGGIPESEITLLDTLDASGCEVHLMKSFDSYRRYDFLHCKYAVIDSRRVVVTSENWMRTSLSSNRGWGAVIEDGALALDCLSVFERDFDADGLDIREYSPSGKESSSALADEGNDTPGPSTVGAEVEILFSPLTSLDPVRALVQKARERVLVELLYLDPNMLQADGLVQDLIDAAGRGVTVKVLLDGGSYEGEEGGDNAKAADYLGRSSYASLEVALSTPYHDFGLIHNKGIVVDDVAIVSSINWGIGPFTRNREAAIAIRSDEIADFFAASFAGDWRPDTSVPSIIAVPDTLDLKAPGPLCIDASNCTDEAGIASYSWDLAADGTIDWRGPVCYLRVDSSTIVRLTVTDPYNNSATKDIRVIVATSGDSVDYGPLPLLSVAFASGLWIARKRIKSKRALSDGNAPSAFPAERPGSGLHPGHEGPERNVFDDRLHRHLKLLARRLHRSGAGHRRHRVHLRDNHVPERGPHPDARRGRALPNERPRQRALPRVLTGVRVQGHQEHKPGSANKQPAGNKVLSKGRVPDSRQDRQVLHQRRGRL
jgi:cardiolipin synthase